MVEESAFRGLHRFPSIGPGEGVFNREDTAAEDVSHHS
eukprot:CAMPEP_0117467768 /NCGR_PEP_ID=MMETSP0784-20121206/5828_1 /TAXON_ID=39447 /ORGANISM="" /LENGTH=37 /DNA_ID= /DNA_START= /DNA_END= /DNA_ORIENTATION=